MIDCPVMESDKVTFYESLLKQIINQKQRMKQEYVALFDKYELICQEIEIMNVEQKKLKLQNIEFQEEIRNYEIKYSPRRSDFMSQLEATEGKQNIFSEVDDRNSYNFDNFLRSSEYFFKHKTPSEKLKNKPQNNIYSRNISYQDKKQKRVSFSKITSVGSACTNSPKVLFSQLDYKELLEYNRRSQKFFKVLAKTANELTCLSGDGVKKFSEDKQRQLWKWLKKFFREYMEVKVKNNFKGIDYSEQCVIKNMR